MPGTYALVLRCERTAVLRAGALGPLRLPPGWYVYVGSALGPGGLRARLGHHLKLSAHPRWHIDYLRRVARPRAVWFVSDPARREHAWAQAASTAWAATAIPSFGCSDCRCPSHLFHCSHAPSRAAFEQALRAASLTTNHATITSRAAFEQALRTEKGTEAILSEVAFAQNPADHI